MKTKHEVDSKEGSRLLFETLIVMGLTFLLSFWFLQLKGIITLLPAIYFFIERRKRGRTWSDIGFKLKNTLTDLKNNWYLVILVAVVTQVLTLIIGKYFLTGFIQHVQSRIPLVDPSHLVPLFLMVMVATFGEELIFRAFFQERLSWYISAPLAILISTIVFALMHYAEGPVSIVAYDIVTISIDSVIYGIVYHRTKNIFASWISHCLADIFGFTLMLNLFK